MITIDLDSSNTTSVEATYVSLVPAAVPEHTYRCDVRLCAEHDGGYSAYVPQLPGVVSEGDNAEDALANIREALAAAIEAYVAEGTIPWQQPVRQASADELTKWVVVHA